MNNNTWRHVAAVFPENASNLNSIKFYIDGAETGYASGYTTMPATGDYLDVRLGNDHSGRRLNGSMDEARISSVGRSGDWIKASYDNQKTSSNFVTRGSVTGPRIVTSPLVALLQSEHHSQYKCSWKSFKLYNFEPAGWFAIYPSQWTGNRNSDYSWYIPVSLIVAYSDDDGNITDLDSNPDQLGSIFPPENPGDPQQVILSLTVNAVAPTVTTSAATSIDSTKASFDGSVTSTGGDAPNIRIYYGLTDGGTTAASWTNVKDIGKKGGAFGEIIGDLIPVRLIDTVFVHTTLRQQVECGHQALFHLLLRHQISQL